MSIKNLYQLFLSSDGVSIDTRTLRENQIFFALKGNHIDGNQWALDAIDKHALAAVVDDPSMSPNNKLIYVDDVLETLQSLAKYRRSLLSIPVLGITGSNGKTTTKELTKEVLKDRYWVAATQGNYNNHIGLPLTILNAKRQAEFLILEMGSNQPGNIATLCDIGDPTMGLITNIGAAHIEQLGSKEGVFQEKITLFDYVSKRGGTLFVNMDDPYLSSYHTDSGEILTYSTHNIHGYKVSTTDNPHKGTINVFLRSLQKEYELNTNLFGKYNLSNIMAALTVGSHMQVPFDTMVNAIEGYFPDNMRSQWKLSQRNTIIVDAYNANPTSMAASILELTQSNDSNLVAIIGDMLELGDASVVYHQEIVDLLESSNKCQVILVGRLFGKTNYPQQYRHFLTTEDLMDSSIIEAIEGSKVLLKGSRGMRLERLIPLL